MDTLGKRIAYARKRKGWSRNKLDDEAKLATGSTSRFERDRRQPGLEALGKLSTALGIRTDWLLSGIPPMEADVPSVRSDRIPNRAEAAKLAHDDGVDEAAIRSVVAEHADPHVEHRSVLWWADRMRMREREMIGEVRAEAPLQQGPEVDRASKNKQ